MTRSRVLLAGLACGMLALAVSTTNAGLLPVKVSVTPDSGNFRWTYAVLLPNTVQLQSGDYFTIYDFAGYIPGSNFQPANWSFTTSNLGPNPAQVLPSDDAGLPNLTWTYSGPTLNGSQGLGNFWAYSIYQDETDSEFTASAHRTSDGKQNNNITPVIVAAPKPPNPVPEPATLALAGLGLPIVALVRARRKARA